MEISLMINRTPDRLGASREEHPLRDYRQITGSAALGLLIVSCCGLAVAQDNTAPTTAPTAVELRQLVDRNVGGLSKLRVPARNADIPLPRNANGTVNPRYQTTEAKRYLGKLLFHDPVRTGRVNINTGQPLDLPAGTAFGGTVSENTLGLQQIVNAQRLTGSCGSCHIGEAATKAGQTLNFNTGGEGRGYTDARGNFVPRRPQSILTRLRTAPIFPGDTLVDALPTLRTSS